jgi:hypothetical protein
MALTARRSCGLLENSSFSDPLLDQIHRKIITILYEIIYKIIFGTASLPQIIFSQM